MKTTRQCGKLHQERERSKSKSSGRATTPFHQEVKRLRARGEQKLRAEQHSLHRAKDAERARERRRTKKGQSEGGDVQGIFLGSNTTAPVPLPGPVQPIHEHKCN